MNNESLNERVKALEDTFPALSIKVENDLEKFVKNELPEKIKLDILEAANFDDLFEKFLENSPIVQKMEALSKANHDLKKSKGELETEIEGIKEDFNRLRTHLFKIDKGIKNIFTAFQAHGEVLQLLIEQSGMPIVPKEPTEKAQEPIRVKRSLIENQGEYIFDNPKRIKTPEFRLGVKTHGISKGSLAHKLGLSINTPENNKGRIQDYIAEKHPGKDIYVRVKLIGYGDKGQNVVLFFPQLIAWTLLDISEKTTEPWSPKIRQAILNGTAIIEG
jgi:hypothetical protein